MRLNLALIAICANGFGCEMSKGELTHDTAIPANVSYCKTYRKVTLQVGGRSFRPKVDLDFEVKGGDGPAGPAKDGFKVSTAVIDEKGAIRAPVVEVKKQRLGAIRPFLEDSWTTAQSFVGDGGAWVHVPFNDDVKEYMFIIRYIDENRKEGEARYFVVKREDIPKDDLGVLRVPKIGDLPLLSDRKDHKEITQSWTDAADVVIKLREANSSKAK